MTEIGDIELRNVSLRYDSKPDTDILKNINLIIPQNKTIALVGSSGSGKSSVISLL